MTPKASAVGAFDHVFGDAFDDPQPCRELKTQNARIDGLIDDEASFGFLWYRI